mmetsp:Transcript_20851/g.69990  ORF Transcript_20851/g.69990 Transcript_20851/m.69990 type:complete len:319 (+) Transcript_20851:326-1282(+)
MRQPLARSRPPHRTEAAPRVGRRLWSPLERMPGRRGAGRGPAGPALRRRRTARQPRPSATHSPRRMRQAGAAAEKRRSSRLAPEWTAGKPPWRAAALTVRRRPLQPPPRALRNRPRRVSPREPRPARRPRLPTNAEQMGSRTPPALGRRAVRWSSPSPGLQARLPRAACPGPPHLQPLRPGPGDPSQAPRPRRRALGPPGPRPSPGQWTCAAPATTRACRRPSAPFGPSGACRARRRTPPRAQTARKGPRAPVQHRRLARDPQRAQWIPVRRTVCSVARRCWSRGRTVRPPTRTRVCRRSPAMRRPPQRDHEGALMRS